MKRPVPFLPALLSIVSAVSAQPPPACSPGAHLLFAGVKSRLKTQLLRLLSAMLLATTACKKDEPVPLSDRLRKVWTVQTATENGTLVYTKGAGSTIRNYASYQLDLSKPPAVTLTEVDGNTFAGQYAVQNDNRLILTNLNPQPTGSGGRLEYGLGAVTDNSMELSQSSKSLKTGNTLNVYRLSN